MKLKVMLAALSAASLLVACGGGGSDAGRSPFGTGSGSGAGAGTVSGNTNTVTNEAGSLVVSLSSRTISASSPAVVTALVKDAAGNVVPDAVVTFGLTNAGLATLSSTSGLTNANGEASTTLTPKSSAEGAGYVTATVTLSGATAALSSQYAFSVSPVNVTIDSVVAGSAALTAYASTSINVTVSAASSTAPVNLTASSTCVSQGKATLSPDVVTLTTTSGSFTYKDKGCGATDVVTVGVQGGSQTKTVTITSAAPVATGIAFETATPDQLCLMGSGCPGASTVRFKVVDTSGGGVAAPTVVNFTVDQPASASLSASQATTEGGYVEVVVSSKTQPTPVRVTAALASDPSIKTVSNALTILSGLPYQDGVTFSAMRYTVNRNLNGDSAGLEVRLRDRFGNPVPDDTVVNFMSEGGSVTPGSCSTKDGLCTTNFVVQNPKPADGRVFVVAYAQGEENFTDANNSNTYDAPSEFNSATQDLGQVVVDGNENGQIDAGERVVGQAKDGQWTNTAYVRGSFNMLMVDTISKPRLFLASGGACTTTPFTAAALDLSASCSASVGVCVRDGNVSGDNPIIAGSTLAMSLDVTDATLAIVQDKIIDATNAPTVHTITAARKACGTPLAANGSGKLTITVNGTPWVFESVVSVLK